MVSSSLSSSARAPARQQPRALLPWRPQTLPRSTRKQSECAKALGSADEPIAHPGRLRRQGGSGGATQPGKQLRRRGPAASAASGAADVECSEEEVVLLDLLLPAAPGAVSRALFAADAASVAGGGGSPSGDSPPPAARHGLLVHHMQQSLGHLNMAAQPWQPAGSGAGLQRRLCYDTPLTLPQRLLLPFGPAAVHNTEEQQLAEDGSGRLQVVSTVASQGVPFADRFTNRLVWRLLPLGGGGRGGSSSSKVAGGEAARPAVLTPYTSGCSGASTRLLLTARCAFHRRVLGPLRGQIEEESLQASVGAVSPLVVDPSMFSVHCYSVSNSLAAFCRLRYDESTQHSVRSHQAPFPPVLRRACKTPMRSWRRSSNSTLAMGQVIAAEVAPAASPMPRRPAA